MRAVQPQTLNTPGYLPRVNRRRKHTWISHVGDERGFIFDAIALAGSAALQALDAGDTDRYEEIIAPTVALSRHFFQSPTRYYKTGVVFLAYINGYQDHFRMVGGQEGALGYTPLRLL